MSYRMSYRKKRNGKTLMTKFKLLLPTMAAVVVAVFLAGAPPSPPAQAQEATATCDHDRLDERAQKVEHQPPEERHPAHPLDGRTKKVVDAILANLSETDCADVTIAQLNGLDGRLQVGGNLSSLQGNDFEHLSSLEQLDLFDNDLTELPSGVFDGLSGLTYLHLHGNALTTLSDGVFDETSNLQNITLDNNRLEWLPPEVFDGLSSLEELHLNDNTSLACIHASQFDGLSALRTLDLSDTKLGNIAPTPHATRWELNKLESLSFGDTNITDSAISFQDYKAVFPDLIESGTNVTSNARLSDPICGSIAADAAGGDGGTVRAALEETRVRPNRARVSDASLMGDGVCGSDATATRHVLWTWQRSADGVAWDDMLSDRQPPDYGSQGRMDGECSYLYTPQANDDGMYVRAYVMVETAGVGANNYHSAAYGPLEVP